VKTSPATRLKIAVRGAVQGVGFRPFVFRVATQLGLKGWVNNSPQGVFIEVEGSQTKLEQFLLQLEIEKPPRSFIQSLEATWLDAVGHKNFEIRKSENSGGKTALVLPDIATCPDCLREIFDPKNRRHAYPFTNCTNCGPRFSIIESLPYDRANTSMKKFAMCPECQAEYDDPRDRRFHAQPNACPACGPHLELWDSSGEALFGRNEALLAAANAIRRGKIVAVKGLGGFHLMVAANNEAAVQCLRKRKHREEKPLALMFPSLKSVKSVCEVSPLEERLLRPPEIPIVLLKKIANQKLQIADSIAPNNPNLGAMLPYTPLHHLLMTELNFPVVATSGNLRDEPICTDEREALERLHDIADLFLVHDRPIVRHVDDSIVRVMLDREMVLRRARGYAPLPVTLNPKISVTNSQSVLAVGAHLKNAVALSVGNQVFISQHIGDLETEQANNAFRRVIADLEKLYEAKPQIVAADLHPDYLSTKFAQECDASVVGVQHHVAHVLSCMAENELEPPALGISWDGTGYGLDGTIWGGEFFLVTNEKIERIAHLRPFRLPGGDKAVKEPRRSALGLLYEIFGDKIFGQEKIPTIAAFSKTELATLKTMLKSKINSPLTSSAGRLFDAVSSLIGLHQTMRFEGQAAMELEFALDGIETDEAYEFSIAAREDARPTESEIRNPKSEIVLDWSPMVEEILSDVKRGVCVGEISTKFHNALVEAIVEVAKKFGESRVVLSGGCFQNRYLTERAVKRLREEKFKPYWHQRVPPNDGGIALGQVVAAMRDKK
jgi:hydrogenase maturation protein HypF